MCIKLSVLWLPGLLYIPFRSLLCPCGQLKAFFKFVVADTARKTQPDVGHILTLSQFLAP